MRRRLAVRIAGAALSATSLDTDALADNRNAIQAASDAFGVSVGIEKIGIYTSDQVRGFSPTTAGNVRIDGLYFDQAGELNKRLTDRSVIRVGIAAQAYPFPAPTGIVDYRLRTAGSKLAASGSAGFADYAGPYFDVDLQIPISGHKLGIAVGLGRKADEFADGTNSNNRTIALLGDWRLREGVRFRSFWTQILQRDVEAQPLLTVGGAWLPPELTVRKFIGQRWAANRHRISNAGVLIDVDLGAGRALRGGLFKSTLTDDSSYSDLFRNVQPDGVADHLIVANPRPGTRSTSGELRLSQTLNDGPRKHLINAILRMRERQAESGGSDAVDFGLTNVLFAEPLPKPPFSFTAQSNDRVRQLTIGVAYDGYWDSVGRVGFGIQKTGYHKSFNEPGHAPVRSNDSPLLFYGTLEGQLTHRVALFASVTRGLEETGVAPDNAVNRGQPLPAARTRQVDAGISYALTDNLKLIAAAFNVE
ncbi:MAG: TonB-dependent receptor, partial [Gemmataceae bacterium]